MHDSGVEERDGGYYVTGTRVGLDSVILMFRDGSSPETIQENFSVLTLAEVYRAIAFYLENQEAVERYLAEQARLWEEAEARAIPLKESNHDLWLRIERARASKRQSY